jgi:hypothetical protein
MILSHTLKLILITLQKRVRIMPGNTVTGVYPGTVINGDKVRTGKVFII